VLPGACHLNLMDKIKSNIISNEFESLIPKFQGIGFKGLEFEGLGLGGLDPMGLEFEFLVSDPSISAPRLGLEGSGPDMFLGFDLGW
jgi:hypothetical protein